MNETDAADQSIEPTTSDSSIAVHRGMVYRCVVAMLALAAVLIVGFLVNYHAANGFQNDASLINRIGRQRMRVNRAALLMEQLLDAEVLLERQRRQSELRTEADELSAAHQSIRDVGDKAVSRQFPESVQHVFRSEPHRLDQRIGEFLTDLRVISNLPVDQLDANHPTVSRVREVMASESLLKAHDAVIGGVTREIEQAHARLMTSQVVVLNVGLLTILVTGIFVLLPMINSVRQETSRLQRANQLYSDQKQGLTTALEEVRREREHRRGRVRAMASIMEDLEDERASLQREIQTRQQVQEDLQASEQRFYSIVESAPTAMLMIDDQGQIVLVNAETEKLFGYSRDELLNRPVEILVPTSFREAHPADRKRFFEQPAARPMGAGRDLFGLRKDGSEFPIEIGLNPIVMKEGRFVLSGIVDITERKRNEDEIKRINQELQQKNVEVQQFVYTVSHDLKSPLVTCKGFVGVMKEDAQAGRWDDMLDSVVRIERATGRMSELIDDLLELSRIGTIRNEPEPIDVAEMVESMKDELQNRLQDVGAKLIIQPNIPPVVADRVRLAEVFENLLGNALKYACRGEEPNIVIGAQQTDDQLRYFVKDNGPGIAEHSHAQIFRLFQRLDHESEGSGVGLAAVARIMEVHGGRSWVESTPGDGATFWIAFPRTKQQSLA